MKGHTSFIDTVEVCYNTKWCICCCDTHKHRQSFVVPKCSKHFCHVDHFTLPPLLVLFYIPVYHLLDNAVESPVMGTVALPIASTTNSI